MKPTKPSSRRPKPSKQYTIGIKVPAATQQQLRKLKKVFKAKGVATLGIAPGLVAQKQVIETSPTRKRRR